MAWKIDGECKRARRRILGAGLFEDLRETLGREGVVARRGTFVCFGREVLTAPEGIYEEQSADPLTAALALVACINELRRWQNTHESQQHGIRRQFQLSLSLS